MSEHDRLRLFLQLPGSRSLRLWRVRRERVGGAFYTLAEWETELLGRGRRKRRR